MTPRLLPSPSPPSIGMGASVANLGEGSQVRFSTNQQTTAGERDVLSNFRYDQVGCHPYERRATVSGIRNLSDDGWRQMAR